MNKEFGFPADWLYYSTREVMENPREFCLNNFQLEEEVNHNPDSQISISEWLAAFPQKENDYLGIAFVNRGDSERLRQFCGEIVNLAIPPRVRNLEITPDSSWLMPLLNSLPKTIALRLLWQKEKNRKETKR